MHLPPPLVALLAGERAGADPRVLDLDPCLHVIEATGGNVGRQDAGGGHELATGALLQRLVVDVELGEFLAEHVQVPAPLLAGLRSRQDGERLAGVGGGLRADLRDRGAQAVARHRVAGVDQVEGPGEEPAVALELVEPTRSSRSAPGSGGSPSASRVSLTMARRPRQRTLASARS